MRKLIPFVVAIVLATLVGLLANVAGFSEPVTYAVMGALIAVVVSFSVPYAFGLDLFGLKHARRMHSDKAAVLADERDHTEAVADRQGFITTDPLDEGFLVTYRPLVLAAREAVVVDALRVEVRDESFDVVRPFHLGAS
jgi:hypothetical protein